uniref:Uncharacterized protein n=1 Tax=Oryza nivara TaxID=4536 RepID=A0A0E0G6Y9_ORYNI
MKQGQLYKEQISSPSWLKQGTCGPERKRDEVTLALKNHEQPGRIRDVGLAPWKDGFPNDTHKYLQVGKRRPAEEENTESKEKARSTHADIMSHWINKEFHILGILIETTNEKGFGIWEIYVDGECIIIGCEWK